MEEKIFSPAGGLSGEKSSKKAPPDTDSKAWMGPISTQFRVRFSETDQMGVVWHGNYFSWFEMGRIEHLRARGVSYREIEERGTVFAVVHAECDFKKPAHYDDLLTLTTEIARVTPARVEHLYRLYRGEELLALGKTVLVTLDRDGNISPISRFVELFSKSDS